MLNPGYTWNKAEIGVKHQSINQSINILVNNYYYLIYRVDAMIKIQDALRDNKAGEAIALIRSAR